MEGCDRASHRPLRLRAATSRGWLFAVACAAVVCGGGRVADGLELMSSDISWRSCRANFTDELFPKVCKSGGENSIGVTVRATWFTLEGTVGPAVVSNGTVRVTKGFTSEYFRKIGWMRASSPEQYIEIPYDVGAGPDAGYSFAVTYNGSVQDKTIQSRYSFQIDLLGEGDYSVYFEGCCRMNSIRNPGASPATPVPWHLSSSVVWHPASMHVSPLVVVPPVQLVRAATPGALSFVLTGVGQALMSVLNQTTDIEGRYTAYPNNNMYLDGGLVVRVGGSWTAFLRDDARFSILWFQSPDNTPQFQSTRALAYGPSWVVVRGDVRTRVGMQPTANVAGDAIAHALGGVWDAMDTMYVGMPSYLPGAVQMAWTGLQGRLDYLNMFSVQAVARHLSQVPLVGGPPLMPPQLTYQLGSSMDMGGMHTQIGKYPTYSLDQAPGIAIHPAHGVVSIPVDWPAGTYVTSVLVSDGQVTVASDFWIQVLPEGSPLDFPMPAFGPSLPVTSAQYPVQVTCGQTYSSNPSFKMLNASNTQAVARPTFLSSRMTLTPSTGSSFLFTYTPLCNSAYHRGLIIYCAEALIPMDGATPAGRKSIPRGCVYFNVTDPAWPPVVQLMNVTVTTASPITTTPVPITTPPPLVVPQPPVVLPPSMEDPKEQLKRGYVDIQYQADLELIPDQAYLAKFDVRGLCAGGRDRSVQKGVTRVWNQVYNTEDSATRGIFYELGPELGGTVVSMEQKNFLWSCVQPRRYWIALARAAELKEEDGVGCFYCWSHRY